MPDFKDAITAALTSLKAVQIYHSSDVQLVTSVETEWGW